MPPSEHRREYMRQYIHKLRKTRREIAIAYLGGGCAKCGSKDRLQFDHVDPSTKVQRIAKMWTAASEKLWRELDKCQLLCHTCHRAKTYGDGSYGEWGKDS